MRYLETGLWADVRQLPAALQDTVDAAHGVAEAAGVLRGAQPGRGEALIVELGDVPGGLADRKAIA